MMFSYLLLYQEIPAALFITLHSIDQEAGGIQREPSVSDIIPFPRSKSFYAGSYQNAQPLQRRRSVQ